MSGFFLVLWDDDNPLNSILKSTGGGWPHITIAYTSDHLTPEELKKAVPDIFEEWFDADVTLTEAYVNSFETNGNHRHDVLVRIGCADAIKHTRETILRPLYKNYNKFIMRDPHVTVGTYAEKHAAEKYADFLNKKLLPHDVRVIGLTID